VYTRQPTAGRTNVNNQTQIIALLDQVLGTTRANQISRSAGLTGQGQTSGRAGAANSGVPGVIPPNFTSLLDFYIKSKMTVDEFAQISTNLTFSTNSFIEGLINVNTASAEVLACVPGIGTDNAPSLVSYRQTNPDKLTTLAWLKDALGNAGAIQAGRYLTSESYQFTADIAAVGHFGRGYSRARFIFDTSEGAPKIRSRQDLTRLGWSLGNTTRQRLLL